MNGQNQCKNYAEGSSHKALPTECVLAKPNISLTQKGSCKKGEGKNVNFINKVLINASFIYPFHLNTRPWALLSYAIIP